MSVEVAARPLVPMDLPRKYRRWTVEETDALAALYTAGDRRAFRALCEALARTEAMALSRLRSVGVIRTVKAISPRARKSRNVTPSVGRAQVEVRTDRDEPTPTGADTGCRWMHGPPSQRIFCGAPKVDQSWCAHHMVRVYREAVG